MSVLIVFGKSFVFAKISKISKTVLPSSGDLVAGQASHMPQSQAYIEDFRDSLVGQGPSHEKDLEIFSKIWVFRVLTTWFGDLLASESFNREGYLVRRLFGAWGAVRNGPIDIG